MPAGVMTRWNKEKGFGFIEPEDGGPDIFCHANDLLDGDGSVLAGDRVRYKVSFDDRKGKDHAVECEAVGGGGGGRRGRNDSRGRGGGGGGGHGRSRSRGRGGGGGRGGRGGGGDSGTGELLRWQSDKGFGFIKPDDGGEDLFCHVSALVDGDGSVLDGDRVSFTVEYNERNGKHRAVDVALVGGGGKRGGGGGRRRDRDDSRAPPPRRDDSRAPPPRRGRARDDSRSPPSRRR